MTTYPLKGRLALGFLPSPGLDGRRLVETSRGFSNDQIRALADDPLAVELPAADAELVRYTVKLTRDPAAVTEADVDALRAHGFDDLDVLDANAQCAHLNYVNRVAMGLGIRSIVDPDFPAYSAIPDSEPA